MSDASRCWHALVAWCCAVGQKRYAADTLLCEQSDQLLIDASSNEHEYPYIQCVATCPAAAAAADSVAVHAAPDFNAEVLHGPCSPCSLDYVDNVCDGFYECWGDFPEVVDKGEFPALAALKHVQLFEGDLREVSGKARCCCLLLLLLFLHDQLEAGACQ